MDAATLWTIAGCVATVAGAVVTIGWRIGGAVRSSITGGIAGIRSELVSTRDGLAHQITAVDQRLGGRMDSVERSVGTIAAAVVDQGNSLAEVRLEWSRTYVDRDALRDVVGEIRDNLVRLEDRIDQLPKRPARRSPRRSPRSSTGLGAG